jgi:phage-related minor tail protein
LQGQLAAGFQRTKDEISGMANVTDALADGLDATFMAALDGTQSMKDAFGSMAQDVIRQLYRVLVVQQLVNAAMGVFGFTPAPQGGFVKTPKLASGGTVRAGSPVMTGESGRELFVPSQNGRILSPAQSRGALAGGGDGVTVVQNINVTTGVQQTVRAEVLGLMPQIAEVSKAAVLDAKRRGGTFAGAFS